MARNSNRLNGRTVLQTTAVHLDCHIAAATQDDVDRELAMIRTRAYAALGITPARASTPRRTVRGQSRPARARKPTQARARTHTTASNGQVTDEQFTTAVQKLEGASAKTIAEQAGLSQNAALARLHKLEKTGGVYREGQRNRTRWYARPLVAA